MVDNITIRDIARLAGCSSGTVSLALNDRPGVSTTTKARVQKVAQQLGYRPNLIARRLFAKKTGVLGILLHDFSGFFMAQIVQGISNVASEKGYSVILSFSDRRCDREREMINLLLSEQVDGMALCTAASLNQGEHVLELKQSRIPFVMVDRYLPHVDTDYVVTDNVGGASRIVEYLLELGHKRIGMLASDESISSMKHRMEGYRRALHRYHIPVDEQLIREVSTHSHQGVLEDVDALYHTIDELMGVENAPTALVTMNSDLTIGTLGWLHQRGMRVPEDVALAAFDEVPILSTLGIKLTSVVQSPFEMGRRVAKLLVERIAGNGESDGKIVLDPVLKIGQSCGENGNRE